jgi:hypothetical protein
MNDDFYSYSSLNGMQYHETGKDAKDAASEALRLMSADSSKYFPSDFKEITWGEVTERSHLVGEVGYALKRQDMLTWETEHPQVIDGKMLDSQGNHILIKNIRQTDMLYHDLVLQIAVIWMALSGKIQRFKRRNFEDVAAMLGLLFEQFETERGGKEGNMTFFTYDRKFKLQIAVQKKIDFGPELQVAKAKVEDALVQMSTDSNSDLKTIATAAFTLIDGKLNVSAILRLRTLNIGNELWNEAMSIIDKAIVVISSKKQIRLYRSNDDGKYIAIPLDIAAL